MRSSGKQSAKRPRAKLFNKGNDEIMISSPEKQPAKRPSALSRIQSGVSVWSLLQVKTLVGTPPPESVSQPTTFIKHQSELSTPYSSFKSSNLVSEASSARSALPSFDGIGRERSTPEKLVKKKLVRKGEEFATPVVSASGVPEEKDGISRMLMLNNQKKIDDPEVSYKRGISSMKDVQAVQLLICFMLKYAMEILLSQSSVISGYYFGWSAGQVAIFLAVLGLATCFVIQPFHTCGLVWQLLLGSEILVLLGILLCFKVTGTYTVSQYVSSTLITFVAAEVLEGVNLALLSQVMSSRLALGTYNGGLLSTEAGTLARVVADGTITLGGYLGESRLLNVTVLPSLLICIGSIASTLLAYFFSISVILFVQV